MSINPLITDGRFKNHRWIEDDSIQAFRPRLASDIVRLKHTGWYVDDPDFDSETTVGIVLRLSHKRGFLAACSDPYNSNPSKGDIGACFVENYVYDDEDTAARCADQLAEYFADDSREECAKQRAEDEAMEAQQALDDSIDSLP